ncbi:YceH family protein [Atopomonas sediminilitoris]|uniref:YceH family protein n=1 Tax=Atopomonas sediminilitoris TaxID=2919919 RepID=UPI001F4F0B88|nr:DUF480 domain-containing protein [Atopomonas sediminilitoris]MCJ8169469.1 DUF480 domain-containing protein [Atopomonas sediminilitoris]
MSTVSFAEEPLSAIEARALACLVEKQATTPESYPLTLNALQLACNQKTSREPVMNVQTGELGHALRMLENRGLVRLVMGSRADRWEQRGDKALELVHAQLVLLALLQLRGPQTVGELLSRSSRLHNFDDGDELQHHLERLMQREMVCLLERQSGQREDRYMHLTCGAEAVEQASQQMASSSSQTASSHDARGNSAVDDERFAQLEARVAELEARLAALEG